MRNPRDIVGIKPRRECVGILAVALAATQSQDPLKAEATKWVDTP